MGKAVIMQNGAWQVLFPLLGIVSTMSIELFSAFKK